LVQAIWLKLLWLQRLPLLDLRVCSQIQMTVALACCLLSLILVSSSVGVRLIKRRDAPTIIAGVPVLNYQSVGAASAEQQWVVMGKEDITDQQIEEMCGSAKHGCDFAGSPSQGGVPFFGMRGTESDLEAVLQRAGGQLHIQFVEVDQTWDAIPELDAEDRGASTWGLRRIGADRRPSTGRGVTVFVLDTGVRHSHRDFGGRARSGADATSGWLRVCNGAADCAADRQGHGTHCAGSAAGRTYGVAPGATVIGVKVLSDQGSGSTSGVTAGISWVTTNKGARVCSMSLGGPGINPVYKIAIDVATIAGVTVVVAGGNSNSDSCGFSPAYVPSAITVGSIDSGDRRSSFSNYGRCTNIWAPGSSIVSVGHRSDTDTARKSGTSMAAPHVAGGAALLLEVNPWLSSTKVLKTLRATSIKNQISGLQSGDTNELLYVGGSAPSPSPSPSPTPPIECPAWCFICITSACQGCC